MEVLSSHVKLNEQSPGSPSQIAKWIQDSHADVTILNVDPVVDGATATIVSPVTLKADLPLIGQIQRQFSQVTLVFHKEDDRDWLIIPTKKWKLVDAVIPASEAPQGLGN